MAIPDKSDTDQIQAERTLSPRSLASGTKFGRYVIIELLGSGGMGAVYQAYDPSLNRGIALKIVKVQHHDLESAEKAKLRLLREAQALAQLSHPNVVTVHDVGSVEEDIFIAMALVKGQTLKQWLKNATHTQQEILQVMIAAGNGLAAAHKAGIIHRDFKPSNVMVGDDGQVQVLDFGLARGVDDEEAEKPRQVEAACIEYDSDSITQSNLLSSSLTHTGIIVGTPLYMSPEQHLGMKSDAHSDQFSFCLVLYEALCGKRPFEYNPNQDTHHSLWMVVPAMPKSAGVPRWLQRMVSRGLNYRSSQRFDCMETLLTALERNPSKRLRRGLVLGVVLALVCALVLGQQWLHMSRQRVCQGDQHKLRGVWDETQRDQLRASFLASGLNYAESTSTRVAQKLDHYVNNWQQAQIEACEATLLRGEQTQQMMDLKIACLALRKKELAALLKIFHEADASIVEQAMSAVSRLSSLKACADEHALISRIKPPPDKQKQKVQILRGELGRIKALSDTGQYESGLKLAEKLQARAQAIGYLPLLAEIGFRHGDLLVKSGRFAAARKLLRQVFWQAQAAGHDKMGVSCSNHLITLSGDGEKGGSSSADWARHGWSIIERMGGNEKLAAAWHSDRGIVEYGNERFQEAKHHWNLAIQLASRSLGPDHPESMVYLNNLGVAYSKLGQYDQALAIHTRVLTLRHQLLGPNHPEVSISLNNLAAVYKKLGKHDMALRYYQNSLAMKQFVLRAEHPQIADSHFALGSVLEQTGRLAEAISHIKKAIQIYEIARSVDHQLLAEPLTHLGDIYRQRSQLDLADTVLQRALAICEKKDCAKGLLPRARFSLAQVRLKAHRQEVARSLARQAEREFAALKEHDHELASVRDWLNRSERKGSSSPP